MKQPVWLTKEIVAALHLGAIDEFGGNPGIRDDGLFESTLAHPRDLLGNGEPSLFELAAAYGFGLAKNHAFIDGNKRVAFSAIDVFLQLNGHELTADQVEAVVVIQDLAAGTLSEEDLAKWIGINSKKLPKP